MVFQAQSPQYLEMQLCQQEYLLYIGHLGLLT